MDHPWGALSLGRRSRTARQSSERPAPLDAPRLLRSSADLGWEGFTVQTFDEPPVMEHWRAAGSPALTLVMVTQGVMQVEQRRLDGPWEAHTRRRLPSGDSASQLRSLTIST